MPRLNVVPSKFTSIIYTAAQAEQWGKFGIYGYWFFFGGDALFSIYGSREFFHYLMPTEVLLIGWGVYCLLGLGIEVAVTIFLRGLTLRLSTYYATHDRMRSDKSVLGPLVEEQPEAALVTRANGLYNIGAVAAILFSFGTNCFGLFSLLGRTVFPLVFTAASIVHAGLVLIVSLFLSVLISWMAHGGDFVGHHLLDQARIRLIQDNAMIASVTKHLPPIGNQPKP